MKEINERVFIIDNDELVKKLDLPIGELVASDIIEGGVRFVIVGNK